MDNYSKVLTFFMENGVQLTKEQIEELRNLPKHIPLSNSYDSEVDNLPDKFPKQLPLSHSYESDVDNLPNKFGGSNNQQSNERLDRDHMELRRRRIM